MEQIISANDKENWENALQLFTEKDIYYSPAYCNLYEILGDGHPYLYIYQGKNGETFAYPFLKRKIHDLPFIKGKMFEEWFDITTPYGYGGPISTTTNQGFIHEARSSFDAFCRKERIITEFVRFHPLLKNDQFVNEQLSVEFNRFTIAIDLTKSEKEIFQNYHPSHKRNIKKGLKNGLKFKVFSGKSALPNLSAFLELYNQTMDRRNALNYYYFPYLYYEQLFQNVGDSAVLSQVYNGEKVIAAAIFLLEGRFLHYHLGCSDSNSLNLAPNNVLFHEMSLWGKSKGLQQLHLGGGYQNNDSLFNFKLKFNPNGIHNFYIGKKIHQMEVYHSLVNLWEHHYEKEANQDFFPIYRQ